MNNKSVFTQYHATVSALAKLLHFTKQKMYVFTYYPIHTMHLLSSFNKKIKKKCVCGNLVIRNIVQDNFI